MSFSLLLSLRVTPWALYVLTPSFGISESEEEDISRFNNVRRSNLALTCNNNRRSLSIQRLRNPTTQGEQSRWFVGRAGMEYRDRDLIPDRRGGAVK